MTSNNLLKKTFFAKVVNLSYHITFSVCTAALTSCMYKCEVSWCTFFKE